MASSINSILINKNYDALLFRTVIRRYWWWIPVFIGLMFMIAILYLRYTKPIYESEVILQMDTEDNAKSIIEIENINTRKDLFYSDVELLRSEFLFEKAMGNIGMNVSVFTKGKLLTEEKYQNSSFYVTPYELIDSTLIGVPIFLKYIGDNKVQFTYSHNGEKSCVGNLNEPINCKDFIVVIKSTDIPFFQLESESNELFFTFNSAASLTKRMLRNLTVMPIDAGARTVSIRFRNHNPRIGYDVVMNVTSTFMEYTAKQLKQSSANVIAFIDAQLDSLSAELKQSKDSLMFFQRQAKISDPEQTSTNLQAEVERLQEELYVISGELQSLSIIQSRIQKNPNRLEVYRILPELLGKSYESAIAAHIEALHVLLEDKEDVLFRLTPESSEVKRLEKRITEKSNQILRSIDAIEQRLEARRQTLNEKLAALQYEFESIPEKKMEFNRLRNIQDLNEKYYQLLTEKKVQYSISEAGFASNNRILQRPSLDFVPVEPRSNIIYGSFILLGLVGGIGFLLFKYLTFNEINMLEDLENILPEKASVLGGVPLFKYGLEYSQIIVTNSPKSMMAEAMRKIRVNLSYIHPNYKTIAISSSISGEGKTFVALNLSAIIAMTGKKVVLIDLDMRKPKVHLGFGFNNIKGMSSLIIGKSSLEDTIIKEAEPNLDVITAGPIPPNPSELLLSESFKNILEQLKEMYDVIIIDNPPVGLVSDGVRVLSDADIPIYVFKSQYSKRNFVFRIRELFELKQLKSLNVILNGVPHSKKSAYGYGYGYGYGGYVDDDKASDVKGVKKSFIEKIIQKRK